MKEAKNFTQADSETIVNILKNYIQNEKALVDQLHFTTSHGTTIGSFREDIWRSMFEQIIPKKFAIEQSVFIIDSGGRVSKEVDLVIFDETYTPYIFRYGRLKFLPIEAAAVVIECKSTSIKKEGLKNWAESIEALKTSRNSYTRTITSLIDGEKEPGKAQTATRPLRILCRLNETILDETLESGENLFDVVISAPKKDKGLNIEIDKTKKNLQDWYLSLNHVDHPDVAAIKEGGDTKNICDGATLKNVDLQDYEIGSGDKQVSLLAFNLQLNQLLMLINNPMLFPHKAYAKMFSSNDYVEEAWKNGK